MKRDVLLRAAREGDAAVCEQVLRSLPDWFGIEESIVRYRRDIEAMETWIAESQGEIAGFLTLKRHEGAGVEIEVMAVREACQRSGIGKALVRHVEQVLRDEAVEYLQVKTLGPSRPHEPYARTRAFYVAMGYRPLEETSFWGEANPCLIMVKHLSCRHSAVEPLVPQPAPPARAGVRRAFGEPGRGPSSPDDRKGPR